MVPRNGRGYIRIDHMAWQVQIVLSDGDNIQPKDYS